MVGMDPGDESGLEGLESVFWQQFPNRHFECPRNGLELQNRDVPHAALDPRHVGAVQTGVVGKLFLRQTALQPNLPDSISHLAEQRQRGPGHAPMLWL